MRHLEDTISEGRSWDDVSWMELDVKEVKKARKGEIKCFVEEAGIHKVQEGTD